jgi:hypothetical protein
MTKFVGFIILCAAGLYAQSERGSIRGVVIDGSGAVLPGAIVTAINVGTNVETSTRSLDAGNYNLPELPPGLYIVQVELKGFKKLVRENVTVQVSGVTAMDLRMEVGELTDSVTVSTEPPPLKSETSDVSMEINP